MTISTSTTSAKTAGSAFSGYQKFVVTVLAFLQFTIVLDFMLLAPLGAIVIPALKIAPSQFGLIVSAYAFGAGVSGLLTAGFADRFDRKKLLLFFYSGFLAGTLLCGLAASYNMLLLARMITGLFAGVVGSIAAVVARDLLNSTHLIDRVPGSRLAYTTVPLGNFWCTATTSDPQNYPGDSIG